MRTITCDECRLQNLERRWVSAPAPGVGRISPDGADSAPDADLQALHAHLATCESCAQELAGLQELWALLDLQEQPGAGLKTRLLAAAAPQLAVLATEAAAAGTAVQDGPATDSRSRPAAQSQRGESPAVPWFTRLWPARPVWAACYSVALLGSGLVTGQLLPPGSIGLASAVAVDAAALSDERLLQICPLRDPRLGEIL